MLSLAEMIGRGRAVPLNQSETKIALYGRAAQLGDLDAVRAFQVEQEKEIQQEQQRNVELEQQRHAMEMFQVYSEISTGEVAAIWHPICTRKTNSCLDSAFGKRLCPNF